jgi:hypothetical protein
VVFNLGYAYPRWYVKTSSEVFENTLRGYIKLKKKLISDEHLIIRLATGDPHVRTFDLGAPFLSLCRSVSYDFALLKCICSFINFHMILLLLFNTLFWMWFRCRLYRLWITWIILQQFWGYKVEGKLRLGVGEQKTFEYRCFSVWGPIRTRMGWVRHSIDTVSPWQSGPRLVMVRMGWVRHNIDTVSPCQSGPRLVMVVRCQPTVWCCRRRDSGLWLRCPPPSPLGAQNGISVQMAWIWLMCPV